MEPDEFLRRLTALCREAGYHVSEHWEYLTVRKNDPPVNNPPFDFVMLINQCEWDHEKQCYRSWSEDFKQIRYYSPDSPSSTTVLS
jgi:hypothetical protein